MTEYRYPTAFSKWDVREYEAIQRVWKSERWTMGAEVEAFEAEFAHFHARKHAIMVNSGSSANLVAVAALKNLPDRPLDYKTLRWDAIVPAIAWSTTYAPLVQHNLDLVVLDVDDTWNCPVPRHVPKLKTRVIVIASILGNPGYLAEWMDEAAKCNAYVIEDNCESLGAYPVDGGSACGAFGDMSTFSFFYSHQISAIEGGMILTDNDEMARLCRMLRAHGWSRDVEKSERFEDEYDFRIMGYNVRPLELHAAVAREQLKRLPEYREARRKNWEYFIDACHSPHLPVEFPIPNGKTLSPFGLPFAVESRDRRAKLVGALRARGIDCRLPTGGSFLRHAYGAPWRHQRGDVEVPTTPVADRIHDTGLFLGNAPYSITSLIDEAVAVMREVLL